MLTLSTCREALNLVQQIKSWQHEIDKAECVVIVSGGRGGSSYDMGPAALAAAKKARIAQCQDEIAKLRRRAAQLGLALEE